MTTITQFLNRININAFGVDEERKKSTVRNSFGNIREVLWGIAILSLFFLLGPFSAIVAMCCVLSSAKQWDMVEPQGVER